LDVQAKEAQLSMGVQSQQALAATSRKVAPVQVGTGAHWLFFKTKPVWHLVHVEPSFEEQVKAPAAQLGIGEQPQQALAATSRKVAPVQVGTLTQAPLCFT